MEVMLMVGISSRIPVQEVHVMARRISEPVEVSITKTSRQQVLMLLCRPAIFG